MFEQKKKSEPMKFTDPLPGSTNHERLWLAGMAMHALLRGNSTRSVVASQAFQIADEMLAIYEQKP